MALKAILTVLANPLRECDPAKMDAFHEDRLRRDLARFASEPGLFGQYTERARVRFQKSGERAILEQWIKFYETGQRLIASKTAMERAKSDYLQLAREHEIKEAEKGATLAKLQADVEEALLRRDKAVCQRQNPERYMGGDDAQSEINEHARQFSDACAKRDMDARWDIHESLRPLQTLIELQHWRRQQRNRVLEDQSLSSKEQTEDLEFIDDLYEQKRAELRANIRIFEGS